MKKELQTKETDSLEGFTKGKWEILSTDFGTQRIGVRIDSKYHINVCSTFNDTGLKETEANAHLIAASKDMYRALKKCHDIFKRLADEGKYPEFMMAVNGGEGFKFITDAINKATPKK